MDFGFSREASQDVLNKLDFFFDKSRDIETFFKHKNYGGGIKVFVIGIICVAPEYEFFFKIRKKYIKSKNELTYDVKLNHEYIMKSSELEMFDLISNTILSSLSLISEMNIQNFNLGKFNKDLEEQLKKIRAAYNGEGS